MLLKTGVDISRLARSVRRKLAGIDQVFIEVTGRESVVTSTYEGDHHAGSLHYSNEAVDFRVPQQNASDVVIKLRWFLGSDFDVIPEVDHIHVEYDLKKKGGQNVINSAGDPGGFDRVHEPL